MVQTADQNDLKAQGNAEFKNANYLKAAGAATTWQTRAGMHQIMHALAQGSCPTADGSLLPGRPVHQSDQRESRLRSAVQVQPLAAVIIQIIVHDPLSKCLNECNLPAQAQTYCFWARLWAHHPGLIPQQPERCAAEAQQGRQGAGGRGRCHCPRPSVGQGLFQEGGRAGSAGQSQRGAVRTACRGSKLSLPKARRGDQIRNCCVKTLQRAVPVADSFSFLRFTWLFQKVMWAPRRQQSCIARPRS